MSASLVIRCRLRRFILERCKHWHIERKNIPKHVIDTIADDLTKQVDVRVCAMLNKPDKLPAAPRPRKARIYKSAMKGQPTLL